MEEWLLQLFLFLLDVCGETLILLTIEAVVNWVPGALRQAWRGGNERPLRQAVGWTITGGAIAALSLLIVPHAIFHSTRFHGISLLVSPLLTGTIMQAIGTYRVESGTTQFPLSNFRNGGAFAFGWAIVRFLLAR